MILWWIPRIWIFMSESALGPRGARVYTMCWVEYRYFYRNIGNIMCPYVLIWDGNLGNAHVFLKKSDVRLFSMYPETDQITDFTIHMRDFFWTTIYYKCQAWAECTSPLFIYFDYNLLFIFLKFTKGREKSNIYKKSFQVTLWSNDFDMKA